MKSVLITGGAKRLGAVMARHMKAEGWQPIIHYNTSGEEAMARAQELGTFAIGADLSDTDAAAGLVPDAATRLGRPIDAVVNSASIFQHDTPADAAADAMLRHFTINTASPSLIAGALARQKGERMGRRVVVNILDQKLWAMHPDHFSYTLSKGALEAATTMMAQAFAPDVRVMGIAPGYTLPAPGETQEEFEAQAPDSNPLRRLPDPEDIARTLALCLTCDALTGQTILVDNGEHLFPRTGDVSRQGD